MCELLDAVQRISRVLNTPHEARPWSRARIVVVYALLGPFVGAVLVLAQMLLTEFRVDRFLPQLAATVLLFSYIFGTVPALATGLVHAWFAARLRPVVAVLVLCGVGIAAFYGVVLVGGNPAAVTRSWSSLLVFCVTPSLSALVLYAVVRWRAGAPGAAAGATPTTPALELP